MKMTTCDVCLHQLAPFEKAVVWHRHAEDKADHYDLCAECDARVRNHMSELRTESQPG